MARVKRHPSVPVMPGILMMAALGSACALIRPSTGADSASPIAERSVRAHMEFLASDAMNGRASGSRDEWIAATYLGAQMQLAGLEPLGDAGGFVQAVPIERRQTAAPPTLTVDGRTYTHGREMRVVVLGSAKLSAPLQRFAEGTPVKSGAFVLMPPTATGFGGPVAAAGAAGAAGVLLLDNPKLPKPSPTAPLPSLSPELVGITSPAGRRPTLVALTKEAYDAVATLAEGVSIAIAAEQKEPVRSHTWNAVGRLPGRDPAAAKEVILLSAHLDHIGARANAPAGTDAINNGADDDASGTIAVLELARALAHGPRPKRTIVFAFFGSEEAGGFGSRYFADKPVVPLAAIVANLQFEMIGRPDAKVPPHTLWLTGYERSTLGPALSKQGARLVQDPHPEQSFFTRSDNIQFARRGVIAHTVSSYGLHKEYHQPSDEIGKIDFAHMTDSIRSMLKPIQWLADSGFKPEWLPGGKP
jgi:aminopeptidase YwaD